MPIDIYADGADLKTIIELNKNPKISGFTTNPSLLRKAGIADYAFFAKEALKEVKNKPFSFEVISDTWSEMEREARIISDWADNVYVKIPIMTTEKIKTQGLVKSLVKYGVKVNLTAVFSYSQINDAIEWLGDSKSIISIFAGRIMDAGLDASPFIHYAKYNKQSNQKVLWASVRELYNIKQAEQCGADIITVGHDILSKMSFIGKNLEEFSWETVCMFNRDATISGYTL